MPSNVTRGSYNTAFAMQQKPNLQPAERSAQELWNKRSVRIKNGSCELGNCIKPNRRHSVTNAMGLSIMGAHHRARKHNRAPCWDIEPRGAAEHRMERAGKIGATKSVSAANLHCRSAQHASAAAPNRRAYPRRTAPIRLKPRWFARIPHALSPQIHRPYH